MKKIIKLLFLIFTIIFNINVYAKSDVYIESVDLIDDSIIGDVEILEDSSFEDMSLKFNIRFYEINSSVKYKVVVKNNSDKNYTMSDNIIDNNDNSYIKYYYSYDNGKTIKANSSKIFYITVKYDEMVPNNLLDNGTYINNKSVNVDLINNSNPETIRNITIIFIILFMFILLVYFVKRNKKNILIPILLLVIFPLSIKALNSIRITMNNNIEVYNNMIREFCSPNSDGNSYSLIREAFHLDEYSNKITSIEFINNMNIPNDSVVSWDLSNKQDNSIIGYLINDNDNYKLYIGSNHKIYGNFKSIFTFAYLTSLNSISFNNYYDTSRVEDMRRLFYNSENIIRLDLSCFDTSNVVDMRNMFTGCKKLEELNISSFNTSNVTDMGYMFSNCQSLLNLDLSNFNTSKVTSMKAMFNTMFNIEEIDVSSFDTSNVTDMSYMFNQYATTNGDIRLKRIKGLNNFNTSNVITMEAMFQWEHELEEIDVSSFDTSNVTNMRLMFSGCSALDEINVSNFNTSKVTDMSSMFHNCSGLTELDLSNFDTKNVTTMAYMFNISNDDPSGKKFSYLNNLKISNFDFSSIQYIHWAFDSLMYLNIELNLNINEDFDTTYFYKTFAGTATKDGSLVKLNYIRSNERFVDYILENDTSGSHLVKGNCLDC